MTAVVDLLEPGGTGPLWGMASDELNATLLAWPPGHALAEHTNSEREVLMLVLEGGGVAVVDGEEHALTPGTLLLIDRDASQAVRAGPGGVRYLSVHRRRGPLQLGAQPDAAR